jgi:outer membrane protein OmpU
MKKVLFATTALVATAGVAAADVTFGGYGRFGVIYTDPAVGDSATNVTSRFRLQIDATAESDSGITFGARARIQQAERGDELGTTGARDAFTGDNNGTGINGVRFFARSGGLEVAVGNIFGALEFMPGQYPIDLGLTGLRYDYTAYDSQGDAYSSGGAGAASRNGIEVLYSIGDFALHVSASEIDTSGDGTFLGDVDGTRLAAYAAYTYSGFTFALGGQDSDFAGDTELTATVGGTLGPVDLTLAYADNGTNGERTVLAGTYALSAATNIDFYVANDNRVTNREDTSYGIGVHHDLGGGTSLRGGIVSAFNDSVRADLGVRFNF